MISILDPRLWLAFIISALLTFGGGYYSATKRVGAAYELRKKADDKKADDKYNSMVDQKDLIKSKVQMEFDSLSLKYEKEKQNANFTIDRLQRTISNGSYRMSVAVRSCTTSTTDGNSGIAGTSTTKEYAELLPETAHDIINVARDADQEVRRTNECIDKYNTVKDKLKELNLKLLELSKP